MTAVSTTRTVIRRLNDEGLARFRDELRRLEAGGLRDASWLEADDFGAVVLDDAPPLPVLDADSKLDSARALHQWVEDSGLARRAEVWSDVGLWSWLAAWYLDVLVKKSDGSTPQFGEDARYVLNPAYSRIYRHLLAGPVTLWRAHRERAQFMLHGALYAAGDNYIEILQAGATLIAPGPLEAITTLYWDAGNGAPKRGFANRKQPGTIRRLRDVLLQLSLTYDVTTMSGDQIVTLLPHEFDRFLTESGETA